MKSKKLRVLVTAVGGDLGQAIVKALRLAHPAVEIFGCDAGRLEHGSVFVDKYFPVPYAAGAVEYLREADAICGEYAVDAIVPASDPEIRVLGQTGRPPALPCGTAAVCQDPVWFDTYDNKLRCMRALADKVELAPFADGEDRVAVARLVDTAGFPVVVKPSLSSGGRGMHVASDRPELESLLCEVPGPLVQGYLTEDHGEYSCGLFFQDSIEEVLAFRRELGPGGCSWYAEFSQDVDVVNYAKTVGRASQLRGSANVQVRKTDEGVRLLEINARFSSLAAARALCGFRDVEWALRARMGVPLQRPERYRRIRFRRFVHEVVDWGRGFATVREWRPLEAKKSSG